MRPKSGFLWMMTKTQLLYNTQTFSEADFSFNTLDSVNFALVTCTLNRNKYPEPNLIQST